MATTKGLGKGLAALFSEIEKENEAVTSYSEGGKLNEGVSELPIAKIETNPHQPRKHFDQTALEELAASIKTYGVIQPIIVCEQGERYIIIAGERRYRAAKIAGLTAIPAIVKTFTARERTEIAIVENIQRSDLNALEEAYAYRSLLQDYHVTQEQLSAAIGKSRSAVANTLRLCNLTPTVQELVRQNKLSAGHARCLVVVTEPIAQLKLAEQCINAQMSVRAFEELIQNCINASQSTVKRERKKLNPTQKAFIYEMQRFFGTKVKLQGKDNKGKITIEYNSEAELERLMDLMRKMD